MSNTEGADGGVVGGQGERADEGDSSASKSAPAGRKPTPKKAPATPAARKPVPKRAPANARTGSARTASSSTTPSTKTSPAAKTPSASRATATANAAARANAAKAKAAAAAAAEIDAVASDSELDASETAPEATSTVSPASGAAPGSATRPAPRSSAATRRRTSPSAKAADASPSAEATEISTSAEATVASPSAEAETLVDENVSEPEVVDSPRPDTDPDVAPSGDDAPVVLSIKGLVKRYGSTTAVENIDLDVRAGSFYGIVGPNGAGKTTTLSIATGLLRPDAGTVTILGDDVWSAKESSKAKRSLGVLPDRLRLFDRLTGAQLLYYSATLRGLDGATARERSTDLAEAFGLGEALGRQVADYSVGMAKKIALAATLIHSPRVLVLDEPFESVDPVSAATITDILRRYTRGGGTVVLSSHSMELVQRTCDSVAIIVGGKVLASGTMAQVRGRKSLEDKFVELAGGRVVAESMEWLHSFSG